MSQDDLYNFAKNSLGFTEPDLIEAFCNNAFVKSYNRNDVIFRLDERVNHIPIIYDGIVKGWITTKDGQEVIDWFLTEPGETPAPFSTLGDGSMAIISADCNVTAVTNCTIIFVPITVVQQRRKSSEELRDKYTNILTFCTEERTIFITRVLTLDNYNRIKWLIKNKPHLINLLKNKKIKQQDIASFLQMTPQTFSKLWKELKGLL